MMLHTDKLYVCRRPGHPAPAPGCSYSPVPTGSAPAGLSAKLENCRRAQFFQSQPRRDRGDGVMATSCSWGLVCPTSSPRGWSGRKAGWQHKTSQPQLPDPTTGSTAGPEQHFLQVCRGD